VQRYERRVQGGIEITDELFGHLRDVLLEPVGGVDVDRSHVVTETLEQLAMDLGHPRSGLARAKNCENPLVIYASYRARGGRTPVVR